jgi:uncharacterized protein YkwD
MRRSFALCITLFLLLQAASPSPTSAQAKTDHSRPAAVGQVYRLVPPQASSAYDLIAAVNDLRASYGLSPYQINAILMAVTQAHSEYQASIGSVTHYSADGSRPYQRALAAGYAVAGDLSLGGWYSENIMAGRNLSASEAVNAWMGDAPHQNTMLSTTLQEVGAGVAVVGDYVYYTIDAGLSTEGSPAPYSSPIPRPPSPASVGTIIPNTPNADGSIIHVVQSGDSLIVIAIAYGKPLNDILKLNNLQLNSVIRIGQKITLRAAFTPSPTQPTETPTRHPTPTLWPTSTPSPTPSVTPSAVATQVPQANVPKSAAMFSVAFIILLALLVAGVLAWVGSRGANK